jgi:hypothetical protein
VKFRRLCLWLMILVVLAWTVTRSPRLRSARARRHGPCVQRKVCPISLRYASDIKAKIRESQKQSTLALNDGFPDSAVLVADRAVGEASGASCSTDLRLQFMSLQL